MILENDIQYLTGIGPVRSKELERELNIRTFGDLLYFFPFRYIDRSQFYAISQIGEDNAWIQLRGTVNDMKMAGNTAATRRLILTFSDPTGSIELVFFKGLRWIERKIKVGEEYVVFGKPGIYRGKINIVHPEMDSPYTDSLRGNAGLQAVYSSTERLKNKGFTNKVFSKLIEGLLTKCLPCIEETLPSPLLARLRLMPLNLALEEIHFPKNLRSLQAAQMRLKFEELFYLQLSLLKQKAVRIRGEDGLVFSRIGDAFNNCYNSLPFPLTGAQKRVIREIRMDCKSGHQMNRLLQGDVGSGKTLVALLTALIAIDNGYQACIMAPTEILAEQHFQSLNKILEGSGITIGLLTGSTKAADRKIIAAGLESGSLKLLIGTHALIEEKVQFSNLGFVVIDEQHRFGVAQRAKLWQKGKDRPPHILVMTATPIPRTLAMTLYGDLDISVIDELPPGRIPVKTLHFGASHREAVYSFMRQQIKEGRQIYMVYPLIKESEKMDYENLETGYQDIIRAFPAPRYVTAVVHGQQRPADKAVDMAAFAKGSAQILVATSVIEVGVDIPNATVMVIESAERFGLSQLHQLRGRVGRGSKQSYCILLTGKKLSTEARARINLMCTTNNGFELAEADMRLRGPGEMDGTAQSGLAFELHIANLSKDGQILEFARREAMKILDDDPNLEKAGNAMLAKKLHNLKKTKVDYSKIS